MNYYKRASTFLQTISRQPPFPIVIQSDETECGLASLTMVLRALGVDRDLEDLRARYGSTRGGMTIGDLCQFASTVGLRGIPARTRASEVTSVPSILFVRGEHFSVLWKASDGLFFVADPSDGNLVFTKEEFDDYYSGINITFRQIKKVFLEEQQKQTQKHNLGLSKLLINRSTVLTVIIVLAVVSSILTLLNAAAQDVFMTYVVEEGEILWTKGLIIATILISLLIAGAGYMMQIAVQRQLQHVIQAWNIDLFESLFRAPYSFFINKSSGLIVSRFNQVEEALSGYQSAVLTAFTGVLNLLVYVVAVMLVSLPLAIVSAVGIVAFAAVGIRFYGYNIQNNYMIREAECQTATAEFKLISGRSQIILEHADKAIQRELATSYVALASATPPLPRPLHAHLRLLAQSGGALVWDHHATRDPERQFLQRQGADRQDRAVCGGLQQDQGPVQLDRHSGFNPGEAATTLCANLRDGTLAGVGDMSASAVG